MQEVGCEKSHPIVIGSMGVEYNQFEKVCESRKAAKGEEIHKGMDNSFGQLMFLA
jgi:hypothetical protein